MGKIKSIVKRQIARGIYWGHQHNGIQEKKNIRVMSVDKTIEVLLNSQNSMVRFGDGEVQMMRGTELKLQQCDGDLTLRMRQIMSSDENGLLITIPDIFDGLNQYIPKTQDFWKDHLLFCRNYYIELCHSDKIYGNAFISRCYMIFQNKSGCALQFEKIRGIWKNREIVIVEGSATHNGVGNNLMSTAGSIERIICPPRNAYAKYNEILATCLKFSKDKLFLLSLGPTAKPLAEDLFHAGYRVLDIGNLDMEYEWFLQGATDKVKLSKHEVIGEEANRAAGYQEYLGQIRYVIEN